MLYLFNIYISVFYSKEFFAKHPSSSADKAIQQGIELLKAKIKWIACQKSNLRSYFNENKFWNKLIIKKSINLWFSVLFICWLFSKYEKPETFFFSMLLYILNFLNKKVKIQPEIKKLLQQNERVWEKESYKFFFIF